MHLGKPKNLLIVILLLSNALLAGMLGWRVWEGARARAEADRNIIELLARQGVNISKLPDSQLRVPSLAARRPHGEEALAVSYLLGETEAEDTGGIITDYSGVAGAAQFQAGGRFVIRPAAGGPQDAENGRLTDAPDISAGALTAAAAKTLAGMGLKNISKDAEYAEAPGGARAVTFGQSVQGCVVFNAYAEMTYDASGRLAQAGGLWCFGSPQPDSAEPCRSAGSVLLEYAASLEGRTLDILDMRLGYRLRPLPPDAVRLSPEWLIVCADREIYLDAYTAQPSME
ncbi:MAG: hypothetical protein FWH06_04290 [Oscillospiraceae bacterium]|nr:hypothetical protein [Oscillospiraceae bacterium]